MSLFCSDPYSKFYDHTNIKLDEFEENDFDK
jgi:hypothetical protein